MRRFSVRSLMALVFICAIGMAAFRGAGDLWGGILLLVALTFVGFAVMGALILRGSEKYWWAGFAFFGGGYLALAFGPWLSDTFQPQLGTTHLLEQVRGRMHPSVIPIQADLATLEGERENALARLARAKSMAQRANDPARVAIEKNLAALDKQIAATKSAPTHDQFQRVGHSLFRASGRFAGRNARRLVLREAANAARCQRPHPHLRKVEPKTHQSTKLAGFFHTRPSTFDVHPAPPWALRVSVE